VLICVSDRVNAVADIQKSSLLTPNGVRPPRREVFMLCDFDLGLVPLVSLPFGRLYFSPSAATLLLARIPHSSSLLSQP
jgi:hypothetical protein